MMMRKLFLNICLLLTTGMAIVVFNSCKEDGPDPLTYDMGVVINGVKWATRNVDKPGVFAASPERAGMFYQWNRQTGWSATDPMVNSNSGTAWDATIPQGNTWTISNDPSPSDWRMPTLDEINTLFDADKVRHEWATVNSVNGRKFTDKTSGNSLFLPAAGYRYSSAGTLSFVNGYGCYWGSTPHESEETNAYNLFFFSGEAHSDVNSRNYGFSIRSVCFESH
jgi:uncharacterized protein (TIGR02145 family)